MSSRSSLSINKTHTKTEKSHVSEPVVVIEPLIPYRVGTSTTIKEVL